MTVQSCTIDVNTQGEFETVESLTGVSFTGGNTYTIQVQNTCELKIADAIFPIKTDIPFTYVAGSEDVYIRTRFGGTRITILESEAA